MRYPGLVSVAMVTLGLLLTGDGLLTESERADAQSATRPNIVFVMTDDLDERSMEDLVGIRRLMGTNGTTLKNAYVTNPLCCPSRATFLRGQYPHNHQVLDNFLRAELFVAPSTLFDDPATSPRAGGP